MRVPVSTALRRRSALAVAGGLVLAACAPRVPTAEPPARAASPSPGGHVIFGTISDARTLNPVLASDNVSDEMWHLLYERLVTADPKTGEIRPRLAESFTVSPDSKTIMYVLRDGIRWSDGSPITGDDFTFTVEAVMRSQKSPRKSVFQDIVGAKEYGQGQADGIAGITVDGKKIVVQLSKPYCPGVYAIGANVGILPRAEFGRYLDPKDASKNLDDAPENIAPRLVSGAFRFKEWVPNDHITLEHNDAFFLGRPNLDQFVNRVVPNATALAAALETGEVDVSAALDARDADALRRVGSLDVASYLAPGYTFIGWNQLRGRKEFLRSKPLRQALAYGLNMQQVVASVYFGQGQKMVAHTPPISWAYSADGLNPYDFDPARAQQLIEADGWRKGADGVYARDGQRLAFEIVTNSGNSAREALLQVATEQYRQIGVNVTPRTESFEALVDRLQKSRDATYGDQGGHDFDAVILGWSLNPDPDPYAFWHSSQIGSGGFNFVGYKNAAVDQALDDGRSRCGVNERKDAYRRVNTQLNEDQPYNFGVASKTILAYARSIQGVDQGPWPNRDTGVLWNIEKWAIAR